jgi:SAM-dependent methyltransferase
VPEPDSESEPSCAGGDDWEHHWDSFAKAAAQNPAQAYRRKLVFGLLALESQRSPVRLLEFGCGPGDLAYEIAAAYPNAEIAGLDLSATGLAVAARKVPRATFWQCDLTQPVTPPSGMSGWATHAVCSEVLEHLDDPAAFLRNARPFLAPGCRLVITVPGGPMSAFDRHIGHRRHFTVDLLRRLIGESGLKPELVRGAGFPFFNLYRLVVVARGRALIRDVDLAGERDMGWAPRAAMRGFDWLFRWNRSATTLGWQLVARAVEPS